MPHISDISQEVLIKSIREIISNADLNVMTAKLVRNELKTKLNVDDLDSRKRQISKLIEEVILELSKADGRASKPKAKPEAKPEAKPKISEEPKKAKAESKKSDSSDSSSDDNSDAEMDDESLARKLHDEELKPKRSCAKKPTKTAIKKKSKNGSDNSDSAKTKGKPRKGGNGYTKPCQLSAELAEFVGAEEMPRHEVVKHMWTYVKDNNLLDPKNKQFAICDNEMSKVLGRKRVRMFGIMKHLTKHFIK